jgi:hypothetical protein
MRCRCLNPKHRDYRYYGGRGITVAECWSSYERFLADVGKRPSKRHSIDRVDNLRGYEPGNVAWRTRAQQQSNRRCCRWIEANGKRRTVGHWERLSGLPVRGRLKLGWDPVRAVTEPVR